jgi:DNA polymerase (family 10)
LGCKIAIGSDAHRAGNLDLIRYGVEQARRAWLGPEDVINCRGVEELMAFLGKGG